MKKIIIVLLLVFIPFGTCFAGEFYSNIVISPIDPEQLVLILSQLGVSAYYIVKNKTGVVCEQKIETQDARYGVELTKNLSEKTGSIAVYTSVYDSDIVTVYIFKNGRYIFAYHSNPGYFSGVETPPDIRNLDMLLQEFPDVDKEELLNILNARDIFTEETHWKISEMLGLPLYAVGPGYDIFSGLQEQEIREFETEHGITIKKIN